MKEFLTSLNIWQSYGGEVDCSKLEIRCVAGRNCCKASCYDKIILLNILDIVIDKCQNQWLNDCVRMRFVATSFFLVDERAYSRWFCGFYGVVAVNMFSSVNKNDANIIGGIPLMNCFKWQSFAWKFASISFESLRFLSTNI